MTKQEQKAFILQAERDLNVGPLELARQLRTPYATLRDWKSGKSKMPGIAVLCVEILTGTCHE
jgi:DNA-binding transcriptional regulator YiaG